MDWFRWWHGTITDPKFQFVARKAGTTVGSVVAVWASLLEHASNVTQCDASVTRGDVTRFCCDDFDVLLGLPDGISQAIFDALTQKGLIENGRIAKWDERQSKREDSSAERTKAYRGRKKSDVTVTHGDDSVTQCDADVTNSDALDKIRLEVEEIRESNVELPADSDSENHDAGVPTPADDETFLTLLAENGKPYHLKNSMVENWRKTFPAIDVGAELLRAVAWHEASPSKRKTLKGMPAFFTKWLLRATSPQNKVTQFQRAMTPEEVMSEMDRWAED